MVLGKNNLTTVTQGIHVRVCRAVQLNTGRYMQMLVFIFILRFMTVLNAL